MPSQAASHSQRKQIQGRTRKSTYSEYKGLEPTTVTSIIILPHTLKRRRVQGGTIFKASLNKGRDFYKPLCFLRCRQEPASSLYCHPVGKLFSYLWQPQRPSQKTSSSKILPLIFKQDIRAFLLHKNYLLVTECAYKVDDNAKGK